MSVIESRLLSSGSYLSRAVSGSTCLDKPHLAYLDTCPVPDLVFRVGLSQAPEEKVSHERLSQVSAPALPNSPRRFFPLMLVAAQRSLSERPFRC